MNKNRNWYRNIGKSEHEDPSPTETRREGFPERYSRSWRLAERERPVSVPITVFVQSNLTNQKVYLLVVFDHNLYFFASHIGIYLRVIHNRQCFFPVYIFQEFIPIPEVHTIYSIPCFIC